MNKFYRFIKAYAESHNLCYVTSRNGNKEFPFPHVNVYARTLDAANKLVNALVDEYGDIIKSFCFFDGYSLHVFTNFFKYKIPAFVDEFKALTKQKGYTLIESLSKPWDEFESPYIGICSTTVPTLADIDMLMEKYKMPITLREVQHGIGFVAVYLNFPDF